MPSKNGHKGKATGRRIVFPKRLPKPSKKRKGKK
jgi:hypothetical protein